MKKASIYLSTLLCPLLCTAMESPTQELSSSKPGTSTRQVLMVSDNVPSGKDKYLDALTKLDKDPSAALDLLLEAKALGDAQAGKKLEEIRKLKSYKEPAKGKAQLDIGALLRKMEPTPKDLYMSGMAAYGNNPNEALRNFFKAEQAGSKDAKKKLNEIRKSKTFITYKPGKTTTEIGSLLKAVELEANGKDMESKLKKLDDLKVVVQKSKNQALSKKLENTLNSAQNIFDYGRLMYGMGNYSEARKSCHTVCYSMASLSHVNGHAMMMLATMDLKGQGTDKPDYIEARKGFQRVCDNPDAGVEHKLCAQYYLAEMNLEGHAIEQPDYIAARTGFQDVYNNKLTFVEVKALAQFRLAQMNILGQGIDKPDYIAARKGFQEVCNNEDATDDDKVTAQMWLADMDFKGQGIEQPDYTEAREGFQEVCNNNTTAEVKISAEEHLTSKDRTETPNSEGPQQGSQEVCNNNNASTAIEENAQLKQLVANHEDTVDQHDKRSKKPKTILKKEATIASSTRSTGKERPVLQRRHTETNLIVNTEPKVLTRRSSSSDLSSEKKKKSEGYKLTQTDVRKALKKKKSLSSLKPATQDDDSECSISETSTGLSQRRDKDLRKIKELLKDSNLVQACGIKLTASGVRRALRELGADGQNKISWNFEKDNNAKHDKIVAQQLGDQHNSLCIHLHGKWYENKDIINHFLNFIRLCDGEVDALMTAIETRKSQKRNSIKYEKVALK